MPHLKTGGRICLLHKVNYIWTFFLTNAFSKVTLEARNLICTIIHFWSSEYENVNVERVLSMALFLYCPFTVTLIIYLRRHFVWSVYICPPSCFQCKRMQSCLEQWFSCWVRENIWRHDVPMLFPMMDRQ